MSGNRTPHTVLQLAPPADSLAAAVDEYLNQKRVRLTASSYRGYRDTLKFLCQHYPNLTLAELEPPKGTMLLEEFLSARWGDKNGRTFNKRCQTGAVSCV